MNVHSQQHITASLAGIAVLLSTTTDCLIVRKRMRSIAEDFAYATYSEKLCDWPYFSHRLNLFTDIVQDEAYPEHLRNLILWKLDIVAEEFDYETIHEIDDDEIDEEAKMLLEIISILMTLWPLAEESEETRMSYLKKGLIIMLVSKEYKFMFGLMAYFKSIECFMVDVESSILMLGLEKRASAFFSTVRKKIVKMKQELGYAENVVPFFLGGHKA